MALSNRLQKFLSHALIVVLFAVALFAVPMAAKADSDYYVQPGDTLFGIAARFGVSISDLATANAIYDVNAIYVGQLLKIPGAVAPRPVIVPPAPRPIIYPPVPSGGYYTTVVTYRYYVVQPGDYVDRIAGIFGVSSADILAANYLANPNLLYVGMRLAIPSYTTRYVAPPPRYSGRYYIVQYGDNLFMIAHRFGRDVYTIARANNILNLNAIYAGMPLIIP